MLRWSILDPTKKNTCQNRKSWITFVTGKITGQQNTQASKTNFISQPETRTHEHTHTHTHLSLWCPCGGWVFSARKTVWPVGRIHIWTCPGRNSPILGYFALHARKIRLVAHLACTLHRRSYESCNVQLKNQKGKRPPPHDVVKMLWRKQWTRAKMTQTKTLVNPNTGPNRVSVQFKVGPIQSLYHVRYLTLLLWY